ncbi:hypothetical protein [Streptomyces sp. H27-C3]|uniref:hypothetical protein n=1 Tax=Streptomyces sp. H27-C3 TaxID=3046305 RepID=UPI0024BBA30E|nr:hypothetical protein [Streptomyces sp. H27-C3]MDJ0463520.1 hypothetical protein [Streptomyces sp. H27-C3]
MPRAGTPRRGGVATVSVLRQRGAVAVSVLLGALLALLMCSGATGAGTSTVTSAGSATGLAPWADAAAATADAGAVSAAAAGVPVALPGPAAATPGVVGLPAAAVGDQQVPGCGESPGGDSGTGPGTPARGSSSYELLHALYDARAASGPWGADPVLPAAEPDRGPLPLDPPSPIDLSVLRV